MKVTYVSIKDQIQKHINEQTPGKRLEEIELDVDEWTVLCHELMASKDIEEKNTAVLMNAGMTFCSLQGVKVACARA